MSRNNTQAKKIRNENRKLKIENDDLRITIKELQEYIEVMEINNKKDIKSNKMTKWIVNIYDVVVSASILIFVYWLAIVGIERFNVPLGCMTFLFVTISIKNAYLNKELKFKKMIEIVFGDLIKPLLSMLVGMIICMICMGAGWRGALNYALDFGNMLVLSCFVSFTVLCIHIFSKFILFIYIRVRHKKIQR